VERAKNSLDSLPLGGGTPLCAGLTAALGLVKQTPKDEKVVLILFTDGQANVAKEQLSTTDRQVHQAQIEQELCNLAKALQSEDVKVVVVDTESRFTSAGAAQTLAKRLMARYVYLPHADATGIHKATSSIAAEIRS
jgi:magnesium chelatase subunit D